MSLLDMFRPDDLSPELLRRLVELRLRPGEERRIEAARQAEERRIKAAVEAAREDPTCPQNYRCPRCVERLWLLYGHEAVWTDDDRLTRDPFAVNTYGPLPAETLRDWVVFGVCDACSIYFSIGSVPGPPEPGEAIFTLGIFPFLPGYYILDEFWDGWVDAWAGDAYWLTNEGRRLEYVNDAEEVLREHRSGP